MIYAQPRGGLKAALVESLRQHKHRRGIGRGIGRKAGGGSAIDPGHWEGDLLEGAANRSSVGTLVERKTRFVALAKMEGNGAAAVLEGVTRRMVRQDREPSPPPRPSPRKSQRPPQLVQLELELTNPERPQARY